METLELLSLLCLPLFLVLDLIYRAERFAPTPWWRLRALVVSIGAFALSFGVVTFWGSLLEGVAFFDGAALGTLGGAAAGVLVYEFLHYGYHRLAHRTDVLWRWAHQMHHSAESMDAFGAYYISPLDVVAFTSLSSLVFFPLLGLTLEAGIVGTAFLTFAAVFQHANVRTPRWVGYVIQRPESHSLHHGRGVHRHNYADLPFIDMLFGTFCNPRVHRAEVGFRDGASARIGAMLLGRDVSAAPPAPRRAASRSGRDAA